MLAFVAGAVTILLFYLLGKGETSTNISAVALNGSKARVERTGCFSYSEGIEGLIESPDYPNNYPRGFDCCYDIARPSPSYCGVKLYVEELRIANVTGSEMSCETDWLAMESCVPSGGSKMCGDLSGTSVQYLFQPGSSAIRFHFHSGSSPLKERDGKRYRYRLRYRVLRNCAGLFEEPPPQSETLCYARITDKRGSINTPYHPKQYPESVDCVYEFIRPNPFICGIKMRSIAFELEPSSRTVFGDACSDFFQAPGCGFLCGNINFSWNSLYQPGATSQQFHFHSDEMNNMSGFMIEFEQSYQC